MKVLVALAGGIIGGLGLSMVLSDSKPEIKEKQNKSKTEVSEEPKPETMKYIVSAGFLDANATLYELRDNALINVGKLKNKTEIDVFEEKDGYLRLSDSEPYLFIEAIEAEKIA